MPVPNSADVGEKTCPRCGRTFTLTYGDDRCPADGTLLALPTSDPLLGRTLLGKFTVQALIGSGGWGLVYKVRHEGLKKDIVLKVLHSHLIKNRDTVTRFQREAEAASHLTHTGIVFVSDYGVLEDGRPYMAMEYLAGQSLSDMIGMRGALNWQRVVPLFVQAAEALVYAHRKGVLHRDLKPSNVFVSDQDGVEQVKILDFGLAKFVGEDHPNESLTATGTAIGTPAYMSPEQCRGLPLDGRSDIYSFGYLMYEVLTGSKAFSVSGLYEIMRAHTSDVPPSFDSLNRGLEIPRSLELIVMRSLAKEPNDRFADADELAKALRMVAPGDAAPSPQPLSSPRYSRIPADLETADQRPAQQTPSLVLIVVSAIVVCGVGIALAFSYPNLFLPPQEQPKDREITADDFPKQGLVVDRTDKANRMVFGKPNRPAFASTDTARAFPAVQQGGPAPETFTGTWAPFNPASRTEANTVNADTERLKTQVKLLEDRLRDQQKQLSAASNQLPQVVVQQIPVHVATVTAQAVPTLTAGQRGGVHRSKKALPHDLGRHIREYSPPEEVVRCCEAWLQRNGYNYYLKSAKFGRFELAK
jgi:serine/threonine-protein kinase